MIELLLTLFVTLLGGSEPIFEFEFGIHIHNQGFHETENAHHLKKHQFKWEWKVLGILRYPDCY